MRLLHIAFMLSPTLLLAQLGAPYQPVNATPSTWTLGAQTYGPTLTGHFQGVQDGQPLLVDLGSDLGLACEKKTPGFFLDYQGPSFGFQLSSGSADYRGDRMVARTVTVAGVDYATGARVLSHAKLASLDAIWTSKFSGGPDAWLGFDLGVQSWTINLDATDASALATPVTASNKVRALIPQIGLSGGSRGYNGAFESKAFVHYLRYKRANYTLVGVDVRIFPVRWFGLRAFYEGGRFDVPRGSVNDDLELQLDRKGMGFGAVIRF